MRVVSLASGSTGNALLIEAGPQGRTKLLIDAGLSTRLLAQRLQSVDVCLSQLQGILVTHEHSDHVLGLPMLVKHYPIPVISDPRTSAAIEEGIQTAIPAVALPVGSQRTIGDVTVTSFPVSHDAVAPCGYFLQAGGWRICIVIDSGEVTPAMLKLMRQADLLILESNHDRDRLRRGPYPWSLKKRILSSTGHLSNDQTADAVLSAWSRDRIRWLWLAHLSRTNNTPSLALDSIHMRLQAAHAKLSRVHISALPPGMGPVWDSTQLWHISSSEVSRCSISQ